MRRYAGSLTAEVRTKLRLFSDSARDKILYGWKAKYCESKSMWDKAIHYYEAAGDYLSLIRIRCFQGKFAEVS